MIRNILSQNFFGIIFVNIGKCVGNIPDIFWGAAVAVCHQRQIEVGQIDQMEHKLRHVQRGESGD